MGLRSAPSIRASSACARAACITASNASRTAASSRRLSFTPPMSLLCRMSGEAISRTTGKASSRAAAAVASALRTSPGEDHRNTVLREELACLVLRPCRPPARRPRWWWEAPAPRPARRYGAPRDRPGGDTANCPHRLGHAAWRSFEAGSVQELLRARLHIDRRVLWDEHRMRSPDMLVDQRQHILAKGLNWRSVFRVALRHDQHIDAGVGLQHRRHLRQQLEGGHRRAGRIEGVVDVAQLRQQLA